MVLRCDLLCFAQRSKPPLDLKIFISSNAFYNPAFFYKQLEFTWFVFALITDVLESRGEVDTTAGTPIMLYNALELYFFLIVVIVTFLAPCIEETLFRGFLQSYIRQYLGPKLSIVISSFCFALFHYSSEQGLANISIIGSLFSLAFFLGFIYEKRGSLLAPIILHSAFNTISAINLYFLEGISKTGS